MDTMNRKKELVNSFCMNEYGHEADFSNLCRIPIAYSTIGDNEREAQVYADIEHNKLIYFLDGEPYTVEDYSEEAFLLSLTWMTFDDLIGTYEEE